MYLHCTKALVNGDIFSSRLGETCQHIAALLNAIAEVVEPYSTDVRSAWVVPYKGLTRLLAVLLQEMLIWKVRAGKPRVTKTLRWLHPKLEPGAVDVTALAQQLQSTVSGLIWL